MWLSAFPLHLCVQQCCTVVTMDAQFILTSQSVLFIVRVAIRNQNASIKLNAILDTKSHSLCYMGSFCLCRNDIFCFCSLSWVGEVVRAFTYHQNGAFYSRFRRLFDMCQFSLLLVFLLVLQISPLTKNQISI